MAAAGGYGAFDGDVEVTMDAAAGGFNAADRWTNDIAGAGRLVKSGSGALTLSGNNSYGGGTILRDGALIVSSADALGTGGVLVSGGTLSLKAGRMSPSAVIIRSLVAYWRWIRKRLLCALKGMWCWTARR